MMLRRLAALALATSIVPASAIAQPAVEIQPGSRELDVSRILPRTDTMAVLGRVEGQEVQLAMLVLRTARADVAGAPVLSRAERFIAMNGEEVMLDSFTVAAATLAPRAYEFRNEGERGSLRVDGVSVRRSSTMAENQIDLRLSTPSFFRNAVDLVLAALPLAEGRAFSWHVLNEQEGRQGRVEARVAGPDRVQTMEGGACDAWRVDLRTAGGTSHYWIERRTGELVQYKDGDTRVRILRHRFCPSAAEGAARS